MSTQKDIVNFIKAVSGQSNVLTIPRVYVDLLKSHKAALLLSQCVYWSDKTKDPDGWFYKTDDEWRDEIGLPRGALETALKATAKYINQDVRRVGTTPKTHYQVNLDLLVSDISDLLETRKSDLLENGESTYTKTTTEITSKPFDKDAYKQRIANAVTGGQEKQDGLIQALEMLTGLTLSRPTKTEKGYLKDLRDWKATPAQCAHFEHYLQVAEKWRTSKPDLKTVWQKWQTVVGWNPQPVPAQASSWGKKWDAMGNEITDAA